MYQRRCTACYGGYCVGLVPRLSFSSLGKRPDYHRTTADVPASMQSQSNFDDDSARPVLYLQLVSAVQDYCRRSSVDALHGVEGTVLALFPGSRSRAWE